MNNTKDISTIDTALLHNVAELQTALRQEPKDWHQIATLAHKQGQLSEQLVDLAQKEDELQTIHEVLTEAGPCSTQILELDYSTHVRIEWSPSAQ